ncbi:polymorphic toxin type 47 domain-containing protein [Pseudomonas sichuanensis]|uniref:polymorphic toxin type 47 domain-containing protein n=1 Tax=Pseudomonas sichuanensis TaxID=2213015 RepID=UPI003D2AE810
MGLEACCPDGDWKFDPEKDLDYRTLPGNPFEQVRIALDEAFRRTGVPKSEFEVVKWVKTGMGSHIPPNGRLKRGKYGGEVNIDDPELVGSTKGPKVPHVGYQTEGKRERGGSARSYTAAGGSSE